MTRIRIKTAAVLLAALAAPAAAWAGQEVVAVLGSDIGPYREALAGLRQELGSDVPDFSLSQSEPDFPASARVVVAFGKKAAARSYPQRLALVYAMAPGTIVPDQTAFKICMEPDHIILINALKQLDPKLKTLGVLWVSPRFKAYSKELRDAARSLGVAIESAPLESGADLPDELRRLHGRIDALWLVPDPLLVNATNLSTLVEFSRTNKTPLFVSTEGLIDEGATASIGPTFYELGRQAGLAARKALKSGAQGGKSYPTDARIGINKTAAEKAGLRIPPDVERQASKVVP